MVMVGSATRLMREEVGFNRQLIGDAQRMFILPKRTRFFPINSPKTPLVRFVLRHAFGIGLKVARQYAHAEGRGLSVGQISDYSPSYLY
jgi:hypothetical protein